MINLSMTPRCAAYLKAMRVKPEEQGMTEYWAALIIAESFPDKALKKFGGIDFHAMKGKELLTAMERFLESRASKPGKPSKSVKGKTPITEAEIEAAKTPKGGWKRDTLASWGVPWPPPGGWRKQIVTHGIPYQTSRRDRGDK